MSDGIFENVLDAENTLALIETREARAVLEGVRWAGRDREYLIDHHGVMAYIYSYDWFYGGRHSLCKQRATLVDVWDIIMWGIIMWPRTDRTGEYAVGLLDSATEARCIAEQLAAEDLGLA